MRTTKLTLLALGFLAVLTACDNHNNDNPTGSWETSAPQSVTESVSGAKSAVKTVALDFVAPSTDAAGTLTLTANYDVTVANPVKESADTTYQVIATIKGTWAQDGDEHDDYLLTFDRNSLDVKGVNAPELGPVTDEFLNSLSAFTTIEDVETSKDGTHLKFETKNPEVEYHFVKK